MENISQAIPHFFFIPEHNFSNYFVQNGLPMEYLLVRMNKNTANSRPKFPLET